MGRRGTWQAWHGEAGRGVARRGRRGLAGMANRLNVGRMVRPTIPLTARKGGQEFDYGKGQKNRRGTY